MYLFQSNQGHFTINRSTVRLPDTTILPGLFVQTLMTTLKSPTEYVLLINTKDRSYPWLPCFSRRHVAADWCRKISTAPARRTRTRPFLREINSPGGSRTVPRVPNWGPRHSAPSGARRTAARKLTYRGRSSQGPSSKDRTCHQVPSRGTTAVAFPGAVVSSASCTRISASSCRQRCRCVWGAVDTGSPGASPCAVLIVETVLRSRVASQSWTWPSNARPGSSRCWNCACRDMLLRFFAARPSPTP